MSMPVELYGANVLEIEDGESLSYPDLQKVVRQDGVDIIRVVNPAKDLILPAQDDGWFYGPASVRYAQSIPDKLDSYFGGLSHNNRRSLRKALRGFEMSGLEFRYERESVVDDNSLFSGWLSLYDEQINGFGERGRNALRENFSSDSNAFRDFYGGVDGAVTVTQGREGIYIVDGDEVLGGLIFSMFAPGEFLNTGNPEIDSDFGPVYSGSYVAYSQRLRDDLGLEPTFALYLEGLRHVVDDLNPRLKRSGERLFEYIGAGMDTNMSNHLGSGVTLSKLRMGFTPSPDIRRGKQLVYVANPDCFFSEFVFFVYAAADNLNLAYVRNPEAGESKIGEKAFRSFYPKMDVYDVRSGELERSG